MGEHAEEALDRLLFGNYEHDNNGLSSYGRGYPTSIRCKRCGSGPFDWDHTGWTKGPDGFPTKVWRLVDDDGNVHVCPPLSPKKLGFEDIS